MWALYLSWLLVLAPPAEAALTQCTPAVVYAGVSHRLCVAEGEIVDVDARGLWQAVSRTERVSSDPRLALCGTTLLAVWQEDDALHYGLYDGGLFWTSNPIPHTYHGRLLDLVIRPDTCALFYRLWDGVFLQRYYPGFGWQPYALDLRETWLPLVSGARPPQP